MKLVQKPLTPRIFTAFVLLLTLHPRAIAEAPAYLQYFDPAKGFRPAQLNLTAIFLQIAGSLEHSGSPEPYLRHIQAENKRITALYKAKTGNQPANHMPAYLTPEYADQWMENWNLLSPRLGLDALAKSAGACARQAMMGSDGKGTVVLDLLLQHQRAVAKGMEGTGLKPGFDELQAKLSTTLGFTSEKPQSPSALAAAEKALTEPERQEFSTLLSKPRIEKADFGRLEHFYKNGYDKLSEAGKAEMSKRVWGGVRGDGPDATKLEAISFAQVFRDEEAKRFKKIDGVMSAADAAPFKQVIWGTFLDLGKLAQAELELGLLESVAR